LCENTRRGWFVAQPEPGEGIGRIIVSSEDMMELEAVELLLQPPNLLSVCRHAGVTVVQLSDDLADDELRVIADVKLLNPELGGDSQVVDECLIFCYIVGHVEVWLNYVEEPISLRGD
jgi:hypothetical protein